MLSDQLMAAFGRFLVEWASFESRLGSVFSTIIDCPLQQGLMIYYSSAGYASHRDLVKAAIASTSKAKPPPELASILSDAENPNSLRNDLVHGIWHHKPHDNATVIVYKPRHASRSYIFDVTANELDEWASEVRQLTDRLQTFLDDFEHQSSP